jgi:hypothetical protein
MMIHHWDIPQKHYDEIGVPRVGRALNLPAENATGDTHLGVSEMG